VPGDEYAELLLQDPGSSDDAHAAQAYGTSTIWATSSIFLTPPSVMAIGLFKPNLDRTLAWAAGASLFTAWSLALILAETAARHQTHALTLFNLGAGGCSGER
jgi:hypothetical protein